MDDRDDNFLGENDLSTLRNGSGMFADEELEEEDPEGEDGDDENFEDQ